VIDNGQRMSDNNKRHGGRRGMTREFIMTPEFDKLWDDLTLTDEDLRELQNLIMANPSVGRIIQNTGGARKMRFALQGGGKSGGIRVIYVDLGHLQHLYLLLCYPKSVQDSLTHEEKKQLKALIKTLKGA